MQKTEQKKSIIKLKPPSSLQKQTETTLKPEMNVLKETNELEAKDVNKEKIAAACVVNLLD